ncbi:MAG: glutathione S-transferase family protein [Alphaproteobacteria bacterium]
MKLLGRSTSGNVQKVVLLLEELGADYTREDFGKQFNNTASEFYLGMNPTGKVPTLVDGEVAVWESNTILRYIAAKVGSPLYPTDLAARSHVDRWMDWLLATLYDLHLAGFKATRANEPISEETAKGLGEALSLLEAQLEKTDYIAGDQMTIADLALAPIVHRCLNFHVDLPDLPALRAWHADLAARPSFKKAIG